MSILGEAKNLALVKSVRFFTSLSITALCALRLPPSFLCAGNANTRSGSVSVCVADG